MDQTILPDSISTESNIATSVPVLILILGQDNSCEPSRKVEPLVDSLFPAKFFGDDIIDLTKAYYRFLDSTAHDILCQENSVITSTIVESPFLANGARLADGSEIADGSLDSTINTTNASQISYLADVIERYGLTYEEFVAMYEAGTLEAYFGFFETRATELHRMIDLNDLRCQELECIRCDTDLAAELAAFGNQSIQMLPIFSNNALGEPTLVQ